MIPMSNPVTDDLTITLTDRILLQWKESHPDDDLEGVVSAAEQVTDESVLPRPLKDGAMAFWNKEHPRHYFLAKVEGDCLIFIGLMKRSSTGAKPVTKAVDNRGASLGSSPPVAGSVSYRDAFHKLLSDVDTLKRRVSELETERDTRNDPHRDLAKSIP